MATMSDASGVMARGGFYNAHSQPQHSAAEFGLVLLEQAAAEVPLPAAGLPLVIADYGAAQGRNSLGPMRAAIAAIRARAGGTLPISVVRTDIPGNDFSALFTLLATSPQSYLAGAPDVCAYAAGRSFYQRLFAPAQVGLGWSAIAVHWLSAAPATVPGHIWAPRGIPRCRRRSHGDRPRTGPPSWGTAPPSCAPAAGWSSSAVRPTSRARAAPTGSWIWPMPPWPA